MPFDVIEGGGQGKELRDKEREKAFAKDQFSWAARECAANVLRIVRGAGKPYELLIQMQRVIESAVKFQELHNYWPSDVIANSLRVENEKEATLERGRNSGLSQEVIDSWWEDGTFQRMMAKHQMYCGTLQIVASRLIGQNIQERAGDREFFDGLMQLEDLRDAQRKKWREEQRAARAPRRKVATKKKPRARKPPAGDIVL